MKYETLLTRYKNLGYEIKGYESPEMEIESIIKWLYDTQKVYISVFYMNRHFPKFKIYRGYKSHSFWHITEDITSDFFGEKSFDNPYDAKVDGLRTTYKAIKFQRY